jgi:hypothetical protein
MTWERVHRRSRVVREIVDAAADRGPVLTADDLRRIDTEFSGLGDFLLQVHGLWARAFDTRVDAVLEGPTGDLPASLDRVGAELARDLRGACRILRAYAEHPDLSGALLRHDRRLLQAPGVERAASTAFRSTEPQRVPACGVRRRLDAVRASLSPAR